MSTQFILSIIGLSISSLIILIFLVIINLRIYRKNPNSFLFKPTPYKYVNYFYSFIVFSYLATYNLLVSIVNYFIKLNVKAIVVILIVFSIYIASIISLGTIGN